MVALSNVKVIFQNRVLLLTVLFDVFGMVHILIEMKIHRASKRRGSHALRLSPSSRPLRHADGVALLSHPRAFSSAQYNPPYAFQSSY
jgi:hypothetical protein